MTPKTVMVGAVEYTKTALERELRSLLHDSELGIEFGEAQAAFIVTLAGRLSNSSEKIGVGVRAVRVTTSEYGNRCFELVRLDGSTALISYRKCIDGK